MRFIGEPDLPNLSPRLFYARTNALTRWLDLCEQPEAPSYFTKAVDMT